MKNYNRLLNPVYVILILCVVVVFAMRVLGNTGFGEPMIILTSGFEEESLFAVWKLINGQDVYADPHNIPFAASYFNWLFYYYYGAIVGGLQYILGFSDSWIPQAGRYLSFFGALWGAFMAGRIVQQITGHKKLSLFAVSAIVSYFLGYLVGFWMFTVRPDIWATAFVMTAFYFFIRYVKEDKFALLLLASILFYVAWGFKHNYAGVAVGCGLFLLFRKKYLHAVILGAIPVVLVLCTYFFGSDDYKYLILESQLGQGFVLRIGMYNLKMAIVKTLNVTATAVFIILITLFAHKGATFKKIFKDDIALLLTLCGAFSFVLFFTAAMKAGSADNYFFTTLSVFALIAIYGVHRLQGRNKMLVQAVYGLFSIAYIGLGALIITGKQGVTSLEEMSHKYKDIKEVVTASETPVYVENSNNANLPWLNPSETNFVVATTYYILRRDLSSLEEGGMEGLMDKGYFKTIIGVDKVFTEHKEQYYIADTLDTYDATLYVWKLKG